MHLGNAVLYKGVIRDQLRGTSKSGTENGGGKISRRTVRIPKLAEEALIRKKMLYLERLTSAERVDRENIT
jgi:hypothetical protein